jgi:chromosome segregation ATPase
MDDDSVKQVLRALARVQDYLGQLPELTRELNDVAAKLAPVLQAQAGEIVKLDRQITEKQQTDQFKLSEKLASLTAQVARAQERHDQLAASEQSLKGRMDAIRERIDNAVSTFRPQAS